MVDVVILAAGVGIIYPIAFIAIVLTADYYDGGRVSRKLLVFALVQLFFLATFSAGLLLGAWLW